MNDWHQKCKERTTSRAPLRVPTLKFIRGLFGSTVCRDNSGVGFNSLTTAALVIIFCPYLALEFGLNKLKQRKKKPESD